MTAGFDKVVRFFDVDGEHNRKVGVDVARRRARGGRVVAERISSLFHDQRATVFVVVSVVCIFMEVAGVALPDMPVHCAAFASGGRGGAGPAANSVIISGRRPFFYAYDCAAGRLTKVPGVMGRAERSLERCVRRAPLASSLAARAALA